MTTKEIAQAAGVSVDTVQRKAKELFPAEIQHRKKSQYTQKQAIEIMAELRKVNFVELPQNAAELPQNAADLDAAFKAAIVGISVMVASLDGRISKIENKIEERKALLPAPHIKPRDHINMIVRSYCQKNRIDHNVAWGDLYKDFSYRTNTNPRLSAKNRNMTIIDYIDSEGMIETLESIALETMSV